MRVLHKLPIAVLALVCFTASLVECKTVFRRTDKYRENFKKLDLPQEEIDPNVAPAKPQRVETISPEDVTGSSIVGTGSPAPAEDEIIEEAVESATNVVPVVDEAVNEVAAVAAEAAPAATTVAPVAEATPVKEDSNLISKYCKCTENSCDCCRTIGLPLLPVRGPGCATISYLGNEKMSVSLKYGDITLASRTISGKRARPVCVNLPGGYSQFCGRVYGLSKAKDNFKACLGFELRADDEVEAALRVSCFKFGPEGLRVAEAEPLPSEVNKDEDDDDDIFGFAAGDEDDDYDDEEDDEASADTDTDTDDEDDEDDAEEPEDDEPDAPEDADYGGFSLAGLLEELDDDDEKPAVAPAVAGAVSNPLNVITPAAIDETRTVDQKDVAQGKDDKGSEIVGASATEEGSGQSMTAEEQPLVTPGKAKKAKKAKKNKKKKAADTESDLAFEILNGILDFFN